ncbi:type II toxin-antitoxin system HicA family toxin [bacterium]|nr:type II toxin-antitoxin system HicA family toxin [bacterium]
MKLPSDVSHKRIIALLEQKGYRVVRQRGSHIRLQHSGPPQHHLSVPKHRIVRTGTLHTILSMAASHLEIPFDDLLSEL